MPTIDDLRDVLTAREVHAGDPDVVRARLDGRRPRSVLLPVIAAAVVAALAVTVALVAVRRAGTATPAAGAPLVRWHVSIGPVPGYRIVRTEHRPQYEMGTIEFTGSAGLEGTFWRYAPGAYTAPTTGRRVEIHGTTAYYSGSDLSWQYAPGAWAVVAGASVPGDLAATTRSLPSDPRRSAMLTIARAMRFGTFGPVMLPFRLRDLPSNLTFQAAYPHGDTNCIGYGAGDPLPAPRPSDEPDDYGTVVSVCLVHAGDTMWERGDRWVTRALPDGTILTVVVNHRRLDEVTEAQVRRIADTADVSPTPTKPTTWLPIRL